MNDGLTDCEREFLADVSERDELTSAQEEKLAEIQAKRERFKEQQSPPKPADRQDKD